MPCLIALFALIGPRVALIVTAIFSNMITRAIDNWFVAFLGFLFLPWTTLAYVVFYDVGAGREVTGIEWFLVGLAFVVDLGSYVGGRFARS
jgi:Flp pilus assembly protein protease CpaA